MGQYDDVLPWKTPLTTSARRRKRVPVRGADQWWARHPVVVNGEIYYRIGALAAALEMSTQRLKRWIRKGWIPEAPRRRRGTKPSGDRRLYTAAEIEVAVRIAGEENVIGHLRCNNLGESPLSIRLAQAWARLRHVERDQTPPPVIPRLPPASFRP